MTETTNTQYTKINILAATEGDEVLRAGEWRAIANVYPMSRGRVSIKFADGGTTVQPIHHLDGAVRRPVVEEPRTDGFAEMSDREVIDAAVEAHAAVVRKQDAKPLQAAVRKTVKGSQLRTGDVLLSGEIYSQDLTGWQVDSVRPHGYEDVVQHYHITAEDRRGSKIGWTCLPDDRFEIERTLTATDVEAEAAFPPVFEAWELVAEGAIEAEEQDAADHERKPSMVNVRRNLAQQVVGERAVKLFATDRVAELEAQLASAATNAEAYAALARSRDADWQVQLDEANAESTRYRRELNITRAERDAEPGRANRMAAERDAARQIHGETLETMQRALLALEGAIAGTETSSNAIVRAVAILRGDVLDGK